MSNLDEYLKKRGITTEDMIEAKTYTQAYIDAYNQYKTHKVNHMAQIEYSATPPLPHKTSSTKEA